MLRALSPKGILVGTFVPLLYATLGTVVAWSVLMTRGASPERAAESMDAFIRSVPGTLVLFVGGWAFTIAGGWIAGAVAGRSEVLNGGAMGLALIVVSELVSLAGSLASAGPQTSPWPLWLGILNVAVTIPLAMLGGHLAGRRRPARSAVAPA
jgi:hypothetical protein